MKKCKNSYELEQRIVLQAKRRSSVATQQSFIFIEYSDLVIANNEVKKLKNGQEIYQAASTKLDGG